MKRTRKSQLAKPPKQMRNAAKTRGRILEVATRVFAAKGFAGSPLSEIVRASGVNKRMVYHYFGDKQGLYRAAFVHQWGELKNWFDRALRRRLEEAGASSPSIGDAMLEALGVFSDFLSTHQEFVRLLLWDGLEGGAVSKSIWTDVRGPIFAQIEFLVKQGQKEGWLEASLDPAHVVISFLGATTIYFAFAPSLADMLRAEPLSPKSLATRREQMSRLLAALYAKKPGAAA